MPVRSLKSRVKWLSGEKPVSKATGGKAVAALLIMTNDFAGLRPSGCRAHQQAVPVWLTMRGLASAEFSGGVARVGRPF